MHARELAIAQAATLPPVCDVAVMGGGATGMAAAIAAAEAGAETVVVERGLSCARTILATGNGRCNFSSATLSADAFRHPDFVRHIMGESAPDEVLSFFLASGLAWTQEETRLYPLSRQAASVRNVLLARAERAGVLLAPGRGAISCVPRGAGWEIRFDGEAGSGALFASSAVLAAGGKDGGALAPQLPHVPQEPALCPLAAEGLPFAALDGRRAHGTATLLRDGSAIASESGEFLFRSYGISGIAAFNLSRLAAPHDTLILDLAPGYAETQLARLIHAAGGADGVADPAISAYLEKAAGHDSRRMAHLLKHLACTICGKADTAHAQITQGGLDVSAFDPETLEADPSLAGGTGLFASGEALDIDGPCGGYNLGWAWLSGIRAGTAAAAHALGKKGERSL